MKTIEERARKYVEPLYGIEHYSKSDEFYSNFFDGDEIYSAFCDGAESEHEELTRWNDPKEPPQDDRRVLIKLKVAYTNDIRYATGYYEGTKWIGFPLGYDEILGWREIHE